MTIAVVALPGQSPERLAGLCAAAQALGGDPVLWRTQATGEEPLLAHRLLPGLVQLWQTHKPRLTLLESTPLGRELAARLSCRVEAQTLAGVTALRREGETLLAHRAIYSSNLMAAYRLEGRPAVLALEPDALPQSHSLPPLPGEDCPLAPLPGWYTPVSVEQPQQSGNLLESARVVLAMGRGMRDPAARQQLYTLAQRMGGVVGATRPAALDGYSDLSAMLGISGTIASPELCLVFGASGATPFIRGIQRSKTVVAVNRDPQALVFDYCDLGIVDSCEAVLAELLRLIER